jgi:hypothetical protein
MGKPSSPQLRTLILWALLARDNGGALQSDLKPELKKPDREALERDGLIAISKVGPKRQIYVEVTDKGWQWAGEHLDAKLPDNAPSGSKVFQAWLVHLKVFLAARNLALADLLAAPTPELQTDLWPLVRTAYLQTTGGRWNTRALLKDIRARLGGVAREALDAALLRFQAEQKLQLYPQDNRQELTEADQAAAIKIGGEARHIVWIEK